MAVLLLELAAPLQSWGDSSRFSRRETRSAPTKSGVVGLIAAAQGRRRADPVEDLVQLGFGVRVDQPGRVIRDFHTAHHQVTGKSMPLTNRYYLSDAVFLAGVSGDRALLEGIAAAIRSPAFPLYLGRRSCPPSRPVVRAVVDGDIADALRATPWRASPWCQRKTPTPSVRLDVYRDAPDRGATVDTVHDRPVSFSGEHREYGWRAVVHEQIEIPNPAHHPLMELPVHDFMSTVEGD